MWPLESFIRPLAYISLPVILAQGMANSSLPGRFYARAALYVGSLFAVASGGILVAATLSLCGKSTLVDYVVARIFYNVCSPLIDVKVEIVEGEEYLESGPAVFMANHQSMVDVLILGRCMPKNAVIMAKKSIQYSPLGPFMTMSGTIFIDRGNNAKAVRSLNVAGEKLKRDKTSLWMFPEGTRNMTKEPSMLPLKKGGFHLAINAGIPIIPIVAENYYDMYHTGVFNTGTIKVKILPPIPTTGLTVEDIGAFSERVRGVMEGTLRELSQKVPREKAEPKVAVPEEPKTDLATDESEAMFASVVDVKHEHAGETSEDEGMVLVDRPAAQTHARL